MQVFAFLGTTRGRWTRGVFGAIVAVTALLWLRGLTRMVLTAFGVVELIGATLNLCALAPLFGGHFDARRNVEEYGGNRYAL